MKKIALLLSLVLLSGLWFPMVANAQNTIFTSKGTPSVVENTGFGTETYGTTPYSYLSLDKEGNYLRVEYIMEENDNNYIIVEKFDKSFKKVGSTKKLTLELPNFSGFYCGRDYNFIVETQSNENESDGVEVIRIIKYSKSWEIKGACQIHGNNTKYPASFSNLEMTELDGKLWIETGHQMYKLEDGLNHQSNMIIKMDIASMKTDFVGSGVGGYVGYTAHSFAHQVANDGQNVYMVALGDGYPRGINYMRYSPDYSPSGNDNYGYYDDYYYSDFGAGGATETVVYDIPGETGANTTGVMLGGMELSRSNVLVPINSVPMNEQSFDYNPEVWYPGSVTVKAGVYRNPLLLVFPKSASGFSEVKRINLRNYSNSQLIECEAPRIAKISEDKFLLLWKETSYNKKYEVYSNFLLVDGNGNFLSEIIKSNIEVNEVTPVVDGQNVIWYSSEARALEGLEKYDAFATGRVVPKAPTFFKLNCTSGSTLKDSLSNLKPAKQKTYRAPMYRLYNPASHERFYTSNPTERNVLVENGWEYVDLNWVVGAEAKTPVYRLFNTANGDHHFTTDKNEKNVLSKNGWNYEGIGWYSGGDTPVYRLFNPNETMLGAHNYTTDEEEKNRLLAEGWVDEGIMCYGYSKMFYEDPVRLPGQPTYAEEYYPDEPKRQPQSGDIVFSKDTTAVVKNITAKPGDKIDIYVYYPEGTVYNSGYSWATFDDYNVCSGWSSGQELGKLNDNAVKHTIEINNISHEDTGIFDIKFSTYDNKIYAARINITVKP